MFGNDKFHAFKGPLVSLLPYAPYETKGGCPSHLSPIFLDKIICQLTHVSSAREERPKIFGIRRKPDNTAPKQPGNGTKMIH